MTVSAGFETPSRLSRAIAHRCASVFIGGSIPSTTTHVYNAANELTALTGPKGAVTFAYDDFLVRTVLRANAYEEKSAPIGVIRRQTIPTLTFSLPIPLCVFAPLREPCSTTTHVYTAANELTSLSRTHDSTTTNYRWDGTRQQIAERYDVSLGMVKKLLQ